MNSRVKLVLAGLLICAPGPAFGAGPEIDGAVSVKSHGTGDYGLDLLAFGEPRAGGVARLEVTFDAALDPATVAGHILIEDESGAGYPGFTWELEGATLSILPDPPLAEHCFTIDFAGLESIAGETTDATLEFIALEGDVTGDGITNSIDYSGVKPWYGTAVGEDTFLYDLTTDDPVINTVDSSFIKARFGHSVSCSGGVAATELAGNPLDQYPFFDYVRAFNEDAAVRVAIDPTRFPGVVGQTCDVYVVQAKTEVEWLADGALADVTAGGAQTESFGGSTIQENTFQVAAAYELDADAGTDLGVGYDVVLDCDRDAELTDGDYIDGLADEAGFYVVDDLAEIGPLATASITYSGGSWLGQVTVYPADLASMGKLPLVVISHGNGHYYTWYDYLQQHLASHGYIVMSHQNNTGPGIETASTTTLTNTDYIIGHQDSIGDGELGGHLDGGRITWIGHSRGAEGVCRAYDRLYDGVFTPGSYQLEDVTLVSSISPNDYLGTSASHPHAVNFQLVQGAADGDNTCWPDQDSQCPFHVLERAEGNRHVLYVHGADHNDFNCCGWDDFSGPAGTAIGREEAQQVAKGAYLALIEHFVEGSIPATDFLWRQYESLRPVGVAATTIVDLEYRPAPGEPVFVIDDFQSQQWLDVSSSGGAVSFDVQNAWEGKLDDTDGTFTWSVGDPMNGAARGRPSDVERGLVFDWSVGTHRYIEWQVVPAAGDCTAFTHLSFRASQGTRHPETVAELGDLDFTVSLRDASGVASAINFDAYGAGIEEPYQRTGSGSGAGWHNEFETIQIRLTDFLTNGSGLDLTEIVAIRFDFGSAYGSARGRIAVDDLALYRN